MVVRVVVCKFLIMIASVIEKKQILNSIERGIFKCPNFKMQCILYNCYFAFLKKCNRILDKLLTVEG